MLAKLQNQNTDTLEKQIYKYLKYNNCCLYDMDLLNDEPYPLSSNDGGILQTKRTGIMASQLSWLV